jgi:hypothetical protein
MQMAITRKPQPKTVDSFISAAPDAQAIARKGVIRGKKEQITLTIAPEMLAKVDALALRMGQSRAALINLAVFRLVENEGS